MPAENRVTTRTLTKQTWLIYEFEIPQIIQKNNSFGFTLTGFDELEPGCGPNEGKDILYANLKKLWL